MRIDSKSTQPIEIEATIKEPWLWKTLSVGSSLDVEVIRKLKAAGGPLLLDIGRIGCYWFLATATKSKRSKLKGMHAF